MVCNDCTYQLTIAYSFKYLIEASASALLNNLPKTEDNNSDQEDDNVVFQTVKKEKKSKNEITQYYCTKCSKDFADTLQLFNHCKVEHQTEITDGRPCDYCNERFPDLQSLIHHRMQHFSRHICCKCWQSFDSQDAIDMHDCKPSDDVKKDMRELKQCDQCGKSYPKGYFKIHTSIHGNDYKFSCSHCPMKFKVRCSLNSHILWKHKRIRNHQCTFCDATFITASARSSHTRKCHLNERSHTCESCGKSFFAKRGLDMHMLTHTGERNFKCEICPKAYQSRYGLNVHLRCHNRRQSDECRRC